MTTDAEAGQPATPRQNQALHATLTTRSVMLIDSQTRELVQFRGKTEDGIDVSVDVELIGDPALLKQFRFEQGRIVGIVLRTIDSS